MKYYLIAGEASGDLHGSNLMVDIKLFDPLCQFRFWGGDKMKSQGGYMVKHIKETSYMGFWEVSKNIIKILNNLKLCKKDIIAFNPDVIIYIDYPGFNLRIAKWAKKNNFKNIYYISPQIWAWKENRITSIKRNIDKMYVILPFEKDYYKTKHNYDVTYVGNPLVELINKKKKSKNLSFFKKNKISSKSKIVALLPGSRKQEIKKILPTLINVSKDFLDYKFIIAGAPGISSDFYTDFIKNSYNVKLIFNQTYELLTFSKAAIVTSGTATLETALFNVPQIVCYKSSLLNYLIAINLIKLKYISLVNLIMNDKVVEEIIQRKLIVKNINEELKKILNTKYRKNQILLYKNLKKKLIKEKSNNSIGKKIVKFLKNH